MKKVMMTIAVVVVLMGISDKAFAGPWTRSAFRLGSSHRHGGYGYNRYGYRPVLGRSSWTRRAFALGSYPRYGRYGYYGSDKTLRRVTGYAGLALGALQVLNQNSIDNRMVRMAEREQNFRHGQHRIIGGRSNTGLRITVPVRRIIKIKPKPKKTQVNEELQQRIKILELELAKLKLQQQAKK